MPRLGASVAFYTLLSLAPLLIIVIAVAGAFFGKEAAEGQLVWQIQDLSAATERKGSNVVKGSSQTGGGHNGDSIRSNNVILWAGTVVAELRDALNIIWCAPPKRISGLQSIVGILKDRTVAFAFVLGIGFLLIVSLAVNAALSAVGARFSAVLPIPAWVFKALDFIITYIFIAVCSPMI